MDDNVYEVLEEFTAELTTTDSRVDIFQPDATARISDDDGNPDTHVTQILPFSPSSPLPFFPPAISIQFNPTSYTVVEGGSTQLIIEKIGTADEAVTVTLSTQEGTADSRSDISITRACL